MSKQLRLVDTPARATRGRATRVRTGRRAVRWPDWKLDPRARTIGRQGVAQARAALAQAAGTDAEPGPERPSPDQPLPDQPFPVQPLPEQEEQLPRAS